MSLDPAGQQATVDLVKTRVRAAFDLKRDVLDSDQLLQQIARVGSTMSAALSRGNQVILFGNGGSAADAQHISAELVGRFLKERRALPATALSVNPSIVTAISNDYSFDHVFARQVEAMGKPGDISIGISTSGNSTNVLKAFEAGREIGMYSVGMTGSDGGRMKDASDECICVPSTDTQRIQEVHILIGHILCEIVEQDLFSNE